MRRETARAGRAERRGEADMVYLPIFRIRLRRVTCRVRAPKDGPAAVNAASPQGNSHIGRCAVPVLLGSPSPPHSAGHSLTSARVVGFGDRAGRPAGWQGLVKPSRGETASPRRALDGDVTTGRPVEDED